MGIGFYLNSVLLGVGLAMDAFTVSIANGLNDPGMGSLRRFKISGTYAFFQFAMPMTGWLLVHTVAEKFEAFHRMVPWIALILLLYLGGKMVVDGRRNPGTQAEEGEEQAAPTSELTTGLLIVQAFATSIDALSVGFTIADYGTGEALLASLIIAVGTLLICLVGLHIGRMVGAKFSAHATVVGGLILIFIGIEVFVKGVFL